ncbi:MAG: 16S rRNA (uracil(1498)-N(3))-methyltransferase [Fimbriimonadales bacterium]|nr:16S rRNA (uracil(1498)-N(3))-methyltransferase [Fimbriimonadales bacterium]
MSGATTEAPFELPPEELEKLRKVLRLQSGAEIAVLPGDGSLLRCRLEGRQAVPLAVEHPATEPLHHLTLAQALPKPDKLDAVIRMGTEVGVSEFVVFPAERSLARWEGQKVEDRLRRLRTIAREACEQCYRTRVPKVRWAPGLREVLELLPNAIVLSEVEGVSRPLPLDPLPEAIVIGPEGGWAPREVVWIADRAATLGPRVLRVDTAAVAAASLILLRAELAAVGNG